MSPFRRGTAPGPSPSPLPAEDWAATRVEPGGPRDAWAQTRVDTSQRDSAPTVLATQLLADADDAASQDIGQRIGADTRELFVSCDPVEALQQQFDHLRPDFIAVHDIGTDASQRLLERLAAAGAGALQTLVIRRQGFGTPLAAIPFVDVPAAHGRALRLYSTRADADAALLPALARTLLGYSRLGAVMVGSVPSATVVEALQPMREAMLRGDWQNRQLLLLPLAAAATVASHGVALAQATGVAVRTTPQVTRPSEAWQFITAGWDRPGDASGLTRAAAPRPASGAPAAASDARAKAFERYLRPLGDIAGWIAGCVFDVATGHVVVHAGTGPDAGQLALHGRQMLAALGAASHSLGLGRVLPDAAITLGAHHLLLRGLPGHPGFALHVVLDKHVANLTLARLQVQRLDALLVASRD